MYEKFLAKKSIFWNLQTLLFVFSFFILRIISFSLAGRNILQSLVVFFIILIFATLYYKNQEWACVLLIGEFLLDGAGHFLEFFGLSLRTMLFGTFFSLWFVQTAFNSRPELTDFPKKLTTILSILLFFILVSFSLGIINGHGIKPVIQDLIPFSFYVLIFPGYHLLKNRKNQEFLVRALIAFLISSTIFAFFTFIIFSTGAEYLQSPYYKWFRDVAMGKITNMGFGFWRIVLPEHLLFVPLTLLTTSLLMRNERHHKLWWVMLTLAILILILNFSRIYILALIIGLIVLKYKHNVKNWLLVSTKFLAIFLVLFVSVSLFASGGTSSGLELLGLRASSVYQPDIETSSLTRMMLLKPISELIQANPILGSGLGATITFIEPIHYEVITTSNFDWGYLELWAELGLFGLITFMTLIFYIIISLIQKIRLSPDYHDFYVGLLAGVIAMLFMNLTSPILFHIVGVIFLVAVIILSSKAHTILESIVSVLYQTFHKLRD
ncbi:MAG: O-antigen ligase family protein [bacterium]|nr:O-antigen ligase family protein [bacterium]